MDFIDIAVFVVFIATVIGVGLIKSKSDKHEKQDSEDFFLAGRGLKWWLIGFSLIAANISAEQFVGMSGQGAGLYGLSVSSWEWIAAITLVVVAFVLLPYFLKTGITTIPEFLEIRYNHWARLLMTISMMIILIGVSLIGVIYAGALTMTKLMDSYGIGLSLPGCCWALGIMAAIYVAVGGLKACAWADLLQGSALIIGGGVITYFAFQALNHQPADVANIVSASGDAVTNLAKDPSVLSKFSTLNDSKMHMGSNPEMPWGILLLGIWIPNFYYWGLNQYITQRILGSASLAEGQKGLVFAGFLKLLIPFVIVIPGIIAFNLYSKEMKADATKENVETLAKYAKANPETKAIIIQQNPDADEIKNWDNHAILIAVYDQKEDAKKINKETKTNPFIICIEKEKFTKAQNSLEPSTKFFGGNKDTTKAANKTFVKVWPNLAKELITFNKTVKPNATNTFKEETLMAYHYDAALGLLITRLIPRNKGILGFVIAALLGAIVSSLAAVLNAASTIWTMDIHQRYIKKDASQESLVKMGRILIGIFVIIGCIVAPYLAKSKSIFEFIQEFQGYVSTGILAVFIYGLINRTSGKWAGVIGLFANPVVYGAFKFWRSDMHFLYRMSYSLIIVLILLTIYGLIDKQEKVEFNQSSSITMDLTSSKGALICGIIVSILTVALYIIFW